MLWRNQRESANVEDRRGMSGSGLAVGGAGTLVMIVLALLFGVDPRSMFNEAPSEPAPDSGVSRPVNPHEEELKQFSSVVLADTEDVWNEQFRKMGLEDSQWVHVSRLARTPPLAKPDLNY